MTLELGSLGVPPEQAALILPSPFMSTPSVRCRARKRRLPLMVERSAVAAARAAPVAPVGVGVPPSVTK